MCLLGLIGVEKEFDDVEVQQAITGNIRDVSVHPHLDASEWIQLGERDGDILETIDRAYDQSILSCESFKTRSL